MEAEEEAEVVTSGIRIAGSTAVTVVVAVVVADRRMRRVGDVVGTEQDRRAVAVRATRAGDLGDEKDRRTREQ
jgi:hypothetical protein